MRGGIIINIVLVILILILVSFGANYLYTNWPGEEQTLDIKDYNLNQEPTSRPSLRTSDTKQFYPNMRFNHNKISYLIKDDCQEDKKQRIEKAFAILSEKVKKISFYSTTDNPDISVSCSQETLKKHPTKFIAGEGGPNQIINTTTYPIILNGSMIIYKQKTCNQPIVELHELLHVFGFEHHNNSNYILYPLLDCKQELSLEHISVLQELYSIEPLAELFFSRADISKKSKYLNFDILIENQGIVDAGEILLNITANEKQIKTFDFNKIEFGTGRTLNVENLKLPSRSTTNIQFRIQTPQNEYNKENNVLEAEV